VGDANESTEATYLPNGLPVSAPDGPRARIDVALRMVYPDQPVKVGDTWKRTEKADAGKGLRAAEATYTYEGIETVGKWKTYKIAARMLCRPPHGQPSIDIRSRQDYTAAKRTRGQQ
jgi:hypothetical protein